MLNVLHGRFVANPAQNSPSHIMKGEKAQMSTVSHWDWIRRAPPPLTFTHGLLSLLHETTAHTHTHTQTHTQQVLYPAWTSTTFHQLKYWLEGKRPKGGVEGLYVCDIVQRGLPRRERERRLYNAVSFQKNQPRIKVIWHCTLQRTGGCWPPLPPPWRRQRGGWSGVLWRKKRHVVVYGSAGRRGSVNRGGEHETPELIRAQGMRLASWFQISLPPSLPTRSLHFSFCASPSSYLIFVVSYLPFGGDLLDLRL